LNNFLDREHESVGIPLFSSERAELAAQDAIIGIIDVPVDDVTGPVAVFALANEIGDGAERVQVTSLEQAQGVGLVEALAGGDFVVKVAELAVLDQELHRIGLPEGLGLGKSGLRILQRILNSQAPNQHPTNDFGDWEFEVSMVLGCW
jgi:hypothetical protein